ncbi:hypothetical protein BDFB_011498, partial [Asbolus verrucosus]
MRRKILALLRYETKLEAFVQDQDKNENKLPCVHCKRLITPTYLRRHYKVCIMKPLNETNRRIQHRAQSQTLLACAADVGNTYALLRIRNEVFPKMKADDISLIAKKDALIRYYGANYLKKHKRAQIVSVCSNKLRKCARLLIEMRRRTGNNNLTFFETISTKNFDLIVSSTKTVSGYHEENKNFRAPSLALHLGNLLKQICDLCSHLIMKGVLKCNNVEEKLKDIKKSSWMHLQILKVLTNSYKKVVAGGKGSRAIAILFPKNLQRYISLLLQIRQETDTIPKENPYLFAYPGVNNQWKRADVIRKFAHASGVQNPQAISSNRLRKQIGTLMQIMNLSKDEYSQFAKFMGHTEKTHKDFYEITQDVYQTAKVSKLLTLFDQGKGAEYKGKPLHEIDLEHLSEVESDNDEEFRENVIEILDI